MYKLVESMDLLHVWSYQMQKKNTWITRASDRDRTCLWAGVALLNSIITALGGWLGWTPSNTFLGFMSLWAYGGSCLCICFKPVQICGAYQDHNLAQWEIYTHIPMHLNTQLFRCRWRLREHNNNMLIIQEDFTSGINKFFEELTVWKVQLKHA